MRVSDPEFKILLVEDVTEQRLAMTQTVQDLGSNFHVDDVATAKEAIALLQAREDHYHVALVDMRLEGPEAGLSVITKARMTENTTEIIVVTNYATLDNVYEAIQCGATQYLSKGLPSFLDTLAAVVKERAHRTFIHRMYNDFEDQQQRLLNELHEALETLKSLSPQNSLASIRPELDRMMDRIAPLL